MNLNNFEDNISSVIFKRGEDYYFDNAVVDLQDMENGQWFAVVEGSYDYEVDIRLDSNGNIQDYACNCPYDGETCKHVVAVLLKIKDETQISENNDKKQKKQVAWKEIADNVPEDELRKFVKIYAAKNRNFRSNLCIHFSEYDNVDNSGVYRQTVQDIFFSAGGRSGFTDYNHAYTAMMPINDMLYKADGLVETNNYKEAFRIVSAIAPECINNIEYIDDSNGECGGAINHSFEVVSEVLKLSDDETFKNEVFEWILQQAQNQNYDDYGCADELEPLLIEAADNPVKVKIVHEFINVKLEQSENKDGWSKDYQKRKYLQFKVDLYNISGETKEAEKIIYDNIRFSDFRKIIVERKIKDENYNEAIKLIEEGIQIAAEDNYAGIVTDWKERLLKIYQELKDIKNIRKFASELFFDGWNEIAYYRILKGTWKQEDQETEKEKIIEKLLKKGQKKGFYNYLFPPSVAKIYIEEKMWSRLFEMVKQNPEINTLLTYSHYLKESYSSELIKMYIPAIEEYAEMNTGRSAYKDIVNYLYKMSDLKGAKEEAISIMNQLLNKYKNRPAMKDEFMKSSFYNN